MQTVEDRAAVTFVIPGDYRSGGVRVTVIMANLLLARGYHVRIACKRTRESIVTRAIRGLFSLRVSNPDSSGWLHEFKGAVESYDKLDELEFAVQEVVIAVGTYVIADLREMRKPVIKVRFNHGFPAKPDAAQEAAWRGEITTITVSSTLVPRLQELTGGCVWGVVPNGIDTAEYFPEPAILRDGIGALYHRHPNKAPGDLIAVLQMARDRWPDVPQYLFSTDPAPRELRHTHYTQYPSVPKARELYSRSKVWVLTSLTEGLPGVVLEAMACGCVVVSSDNDGSLEILRHQQNGLIVPRGDRAQFLHQIERVLMDDALRCHLASEASRTVQQFTWERAADRMELFLADVLHAQGRLPSARV